MLKSYFTIGWRNLLRNKGYSVINIGGLAIGITVAMFIGLWIHDELSFNKYHANYDRIAIVRHGGIDPQSGEYFGGPALQFPVGATLKSNYSHLFETVVQAWWPGDYAISDGRDKKFSKKGIFLEGPALEMFSFKMIKGTYHSLDGQNSVVISESMARTLFGDEDPMNKAIRIDNRMDAEVTGVFEDIPRNNMLGDLQFVAPWSLFYANNTWLHGLDTDWGSHMTNVYVLIQENTTTDAVNDAIHNLFRENAPTDFHSGIDKYKTYAEIYPMSLWHLFSEFEDGKPAGGRITFVWLFGTVGAFVLLLACINFVNLSTARSEKRAREVGVRKAIGSAKQQLIAQFLSESFMVVIIAFVLSLILLALLQPQFNELADKQISLPFTSLLFWAIATGFILFTGLLAGVYPAFYLSSFQPARVLKGALRLGRFGSLPRKVLVVAQFTVSVMLVIGTLVVYTQVQYARDRPVGYSRDGLIFMPIPDPAMRLKVNTLRNELLATGVVANVATSSTPLTETWSTTSGFLWEGKDPNMDGEFANVNVTYDFGTAIGWKIVAGRDFSRDLLSDSTESIIVNEAAVKYMRLKDPIGQKFTDIDGDGNVIWSRTIIGVVKDLVVMSPYEPVMQTIYYMGADASNVLHVRIDPSVSATAALPKIKDAFVKVNPGADFDYRFVDEVFARKFSQEERVGMLAAVFAVLAIFISCLGLFGLASFVAEQRTKEIGIRKMMGASVSNLWRMLWRDFVVLVIIACCIAIPAGYSIMTQWLKKFEYRTDISWWIVLSICAAAVVITLLTVSYQSIKAAMQNPVKSLRTE